jgi:hypothetical protein
MTTITCKACTVTMLTWSEQKRQFARCIQKYGLTKDEAAKLMPRCQKCVTEVLGKRAPSVYPTTGVMRAPAASPSERGRAFPITRYLKT